MASEKKKSNESATSTRRRQSRPRSRFLVCIDNRGYEASLEQNKIYLAMIDKRAEKDGDVRIVDESGEDYLYSEERFVPIDVPKIVKASVRNRVAA